MLTVVKCNCAACGTAHEMLPTAFTLVYCRHVAEPWMVWRCPNCDKPRKWDLRIIKPDLAHDLTRCVTRKLILEDNDEARGLITTDMIIDVDTDWQALSTEVGHPPTLSRGAE